jgi:hypothetical protein
VKGLIRSRKRTVQHERSARGLLCAQWQLQELGSRGVLTATHVVVGAATRTWKCRLKRKGRGMDERRVSVELRSWDSTGVDVGVVEGSRLWLVGSWLGRFSPILELKAGEDTFRRGSALVCFWRRSSQSRLGLGTSQSFHPRSHITAEDGLRQDE